MNRDLRWRVEYQDGRVKVSAADSWANVPGEGVARVVFSRGDASCSVEGMDYYWLHQFFFGGFLEGADFSARKRCVGFAWPQYWRRMELRFPKPHPRARVIQGGS